MDDMWFIFVLFILVVVVFFYIGPSVFDSEDIPEQTQHFCTDNGGIIFTRIERVLGNENKFQFMTEQEFKKYCYNRQLEGNR